MKFEAGKRAQVMAALTLASPAAAALALNTAAGTAMAPRSTCRHPTPSCVNNFQPISPLLVRATARTPPPRCAGKFGTKTYWDDMYAVTGTAADDGLPADEYSWYCGFAELAPFFAELVPDRAARLLVPGVGNDATVAALYDAGWTRLTAFDYSAGAIERLRPLIGERAIALHVADARALPFETASFDAVLDKGALDAIGIGGAADLQRAVDELGRVVTPGGVVVAVSRALEPDELLRPFAGEEWEILRDGGLHICESGEVSTDLAAGLYAWRRRRT